MTATVPASPLTAIIAGKTDTGGGAYFGTVRNTGQSDLATIQLSVTF